MCAPCRGAIEKVFGKSWPPEHDRLYRISRAFGGAPDIPFSVLDDQRYLPRCNKHRTTPSRSRRPGGSR